VKKDTVLARIKGEVQIFPLSPESFGIALRAVAPV
jgi:hypothetical protein